MIARRKLLLAAAGILPGAAVVKALKAMSSSDGEGEPISDALDAKGKTFRHSYVDPTKVERSITDYGAIGDGTTDNTLAIRRAIRECPAGATLFIPAGKFRFTQQIICNRPINWKGEGNASCLWAEQSVWPLPPWVSTGAMLQFGYPYAGFPGQPERGVYGVSISDFSVSGTGDANPGFALGFFHVMQSRISGILCDANADRGGTAFAGLNGTTAEIRCDLGGGSSPYATQNPYIDSKPISIGQPYRKGEYTVADLKFRGVNFPVNGLARKYYQISGPGATSSRVVGNTSDTVTVIVGLAGRSWPAGTPTTSSTVRVFDSSSARSGSEAMVIMLDLGANKAPFAGRPAGYGHSTDPMNANRFNFILRGNGGNSPAGLLVERQDQGGNNTFSGLFEGFPDTGGRYKRDYHESKYCMKISGCSGFSINDAHFENAGSGDLNDPCLIIGDDVTPTHFFTLGPRLFCDQKIQMRGGATKFSLLGVRTSVLEMKRSLTEGTDWDRNAACEIVRPIVRT